MRRMTRRQRLARECLRKLWQIHDAGGISYGRSEESVLLEAAMRLLGPDESFIALSDTNTPEFMRVVNGELHKVMQEELKKDDERLFGAKRR